MTESDERDGLRSLVESLSDGGSVDWERARASQPGFASKLDVLQVLEQVRRVHRATLPETIQSDSLPEVSTEWGPLRIIERLGSGGFGDVYRARDPQLERDVALKLQREDRRWSAADEERFLNEARRLARVRHENVVVVHGAAKHGGRVGLWTELIEGQTLDRLVDGSRRLGAQEAALIGLDLCRALAAIHAEGLVHRDVKPANVVRETNGRIVLLDFGAMADVRSAGGDGARVSGTPIFMPPEVLRGEEPGVAGDIYSLGVLLYYLVSKRYPVEADSLSELQQKHAGGQITPLRDVRPDLPVAFVQVVERTLANDPARRFASMGEMEAALANALAPSGTVADSTGARPHRSRRAIVGFGLALAAAAVAIWFAWPTPGLTAGAELFRRGANGEERLGPGTQLHLDDQLFLEIEGSLAMHVYVMNADERGEEFALFPLDVLDQRNPLAPGAKQRLPGTVGGEMRYWSVSSTGGTETFLIVASPEPVEEVEEALARLTQAGAGRSDRVAQAGPLMRGVGGLVAPEASGAASTPATGGDLGELAYDLRASRRGDVWVWEVRMKNPGR